MLLASPMVLTNLAQSLIHATDVVLLGQVGPRTLAAAALGVNLYVFCLIFGMGLLTAAAPMIARERGRRASSVRDVRRTVRQAMWSAVLLVLPMWACCGTPRPCCCCSASSPTSPPTRRPSCAS
jgi:MATE family multidrug resistance protein